jgi:hypothetical protein
MGKYIEDSINLLEKLKGEGYQEVCLGCNTVYRKKPLEDYADGHGGRLLEMCNRCGSDLFEKIDETILRLKESKNSYKG